MKFSDLYELGDLVDVKDIDENSETLGAYFEAKIIKITKVIHDFKYSLLLIHCNIRQRTG